MFLLEQGEWWEKQAPEGKEKPQKSQASNCLKRIYTKQLVFNAITNRDWSLQNNVLTLDKMTVTNYLLKNYIETSSLNSKIDSTKKHLKFRRQW